jgi:hypothetical protein
MQLYIDNNNWFVLYIDSLDVDTDDNYYSVSFLYALIDDDAYCLIVIVTSIVGIE